MQQLRPCQVNAPNPEVLFTPPTGINWLQFDVQINIVSVIEDEITTLNGRGR